MKAVILTIDDNMLNGLSENSVENKLSHMLFSKGIELYANSTISSSSESINFALNNLPDDVNTIIILGNKQPTANLLIKKQLADYMQDKLSINAYSKNAIEQYYKNLNQPVETKSLEEAKIPESSNPIENTSSYSQGFVAYYNGKHIIFLPNDNNSIKNVYNNWLTDYIEAKFSKLSLTKTIKTYGLSKNQALKLFKDLLKNKNQIKVYIYEQDLELTIKIKYSPLTPKEDINAYLKNLTDRIKNYIYALNDQSIYEKASQIIKSNQTKIAIAESITGGNIASNLVKHNEGISKHLMEVIVAYTNDSKISRLNVSGEIIEKHTAVSAEVVYEMAAGLLETCKNADLVLATTGYAESNGEESGLTFIAVGDYNGIHIYKNKLTGDRQTVIQKATKTALFYLIKKLNKNNINIEQMFDKE
jgi:nicotinamide-nucleotide amidase